MYGLLFLNLSEFVINKVICQMQICLNRGLNAITISNLNKDYIAFKIKLLVKCIECSFSLKPLVWGQHVEEGEGTSKYRE